MSQPSPLQDRADDLLMRLRRKKPTRGDVTAHVQGATMEALNAIADEICGGRPHRGTHCDRPPGYGGDDQPADWCAAATFLHVWEKLVRPRLWGVR